MQVKEMDNFATVALNLLKALHVHFGCQPAASLADQVSKSIAAKIAASERQRPKVIQLTSAFGHIVDNLAPSARKSRSDLFERQGPEGWRLQDQLRRAGMIRLRFLKVLREQWSRYRCAEPAIPVTLLSSKFLNWAAELPVTSKENPLWHVILSPSPRKCQVWIERAVGHFEAKLVVQGKALNTRAAGSQLHADPMQVWQVPQCAACGSTCRSRWGRCTEA